MWWLVASLALVAACSNNKKENDTAAPEPTPLSVEEIIVSPKAGSPGDTLLMTADIRSSSPNVGDIPTTDWSATGGTLIDHNQLTVRWVAPPSPGMFRISVKATNAAGSASDNVDVFVGSEVVRVPTQAGEIKLLPGGSEFYFRHATSLSAGTEAYAYIGGVQSDPIVSASSVGGDLAFSPSLAFEAHARTVTSNDSTTITNPILRPRHIYLGDLNGGGLQRITKDLAQTDSPRRNQFTLPSFSPDGTMVAYQGLVTHVFAVSFDSVDVFVYNRNGPTRVRVTGTHPNHRNYYPSFSTDQKWLTFISDRSGNSQWELYGVPVSGGVVDTNPASVTRLTQTGGTIAPGTGAAPGRPVMAWNPLGSTLAIAAADGTLYLVTTDAAGASSEVVSGIPNSIQELRWSGDGSMLVVVATGEADEKPIQMIFTVTGSTAQQRLVSIPGDGTRDVALSPDKLWLVFRRTRVNSAWFELLDLTGGRYPQPVPLTGAGPVSNLLTYRVAMPMNAVWGAANTLFLLRFASSDATATPQIVSLDVSGAVQ